MKEGVLAREGPTPVRCRYRPRTPGSSQASEDKTWLRFWRHHVTTPGTLPHPPHPLPYIGPPHSNSLGARDPEPVPRGQRPLLHHQAHGAEASQVLHQGL